MRHVGDITALSGYKLSPVDVVTGGSPCQDLSVAGKRAGLAGERSGLFLEQIRVVKELRNADRQRGRTGIYIRPRFLVWENVPGAFSSNGGQDFRAVLEECVRIAEPAAPDIPCPARWPLADAYFGDGWSVAYRVFDAQFWGVPQRRRRIALVCDFGGHAAPEILFVRKGVSGDSAAGGTPGEIPAGNAEDNAYPAIARTLTSRYDSSPWIGGGQNVVFQAAGFKGGQSKDGSLGYQEEVAPTLNAGMSALEPTVYDARGNGDGKTVCTLTGDHENRVTDYTALVMAHGQANAEVLRNLSPTLSCNHEQPILAIGLDCEHNAYPEQYGTLRAHTSGGSEEKVMVAHTLTATGHDLRDADNATYPITGGIVRRLTPLECERLQGYPDGYTDIGEWTDSKGKRRQTSDAARYKALGNSIALPPWKWVLKRIAAQYERDATLGSLFDGIGGFPLIWETINGKGSCLWASEIEEFCIAVTKCRFYNDE